MKNISVYKAVGSSLTMGGGEPWPLCWVAGCLGLFHFVVLGQHWMAVSVTPQHSIKKLASEGAAAGKSTVAPDELALLR